MPTLLLTIALAVAPALAQVPAASLAGHVADQTGTPLPGVSVQLTSTDRKTVLTAVTDTDGNYVVAGVPTGQYAVMFAEPGFADVHRTGVSITAGAPTRLDAVLQLAANASVVVTGRDTFRNLADLDHPEENLVGVANAASEGAVTAAQLEARPIMRAGEVLEAVPGVIISQHSGEGKANQYYLRGFNLDHGTDFATTVAGLPVNLPTNAHGQGYSDLNFLIPELVTGVQFRKGTYDASQGDFSAAGSATIDYANALDRPLAAVSAGVDGWRRAFAAASPRLGAGTLLTAIELNHNDGPWVDPDGYDRVNGVVRYSRGNAANGFSLTGLAYAGAWHSTDQVPDRAIADGLISRFGAIDPTDGGRTARYSGIADYQHTSEDARTRVTAYVSRYRLNLFSDFTYFLDDPVHGDQFEQEDRRWTTGGQASQTRHLRWGHRLGEYTVGVQLRRDDIPIVGLYHTEDRVRLSTTRQDAVTETSAAAYVSSELRWTPWLRMTSGVRLDGYWFDVRSDDAANSGARRANLVSPKGGVIFGPWRSTEIYLNAGLGFHSNDARGTTITRDPATGDAVDPVTPLVRARGVEAGIRSVAVPHVQTTLSAWRLDLDSELVFAGDAGSTEASRPSERYGLEWTNYVRLSRVFVLDADLAWSHARFTDADPVGPFIPGAAKTIGSLGLTAETTRGPFGSVRVRYFGPRPLIEDASVQSRATGLVNAEVGYHVTPRVHLILDGFNLLNAADSDIDYYYVSRLPGEPADGVADIHTHPTLPRTLRLVLRVQF